MAEKKPEIKLGPKGKIQRLAEEPRRGNPMGEYQVPKRDIPASNMPKAQPPQPLTPRAKDRARVRGLKDLRADKRA